MPQADDLSRSLVPFQQDATLVAVIEMSQSSWLVAATVPGVDRQPRKKIVPDETALLRLLLRWRDEAIQSGRTIARITVAYEAGRDGFWLARWLIACLSGYYPHPQHVGCCPATGQVVAEAARPTCRVFGWTPDRQTKTIRSAACASAP